MPASGQSSAATAPARIANPSEPAPKRVLACVLCQQRKVKCDRKSPCSNCSRLNAQCVSASLVPRQRRRRFPERDLLERLRQYEGLLRKNNIKFHPLHEPTPDKACPSDRGMGAESLEDAYSEEGSVIGTGLTTEDKLTVKPEIVYETKLRVPRHPRYLRRLIISQKFLACHESTDDHNGDNGGEDEEDDRHFPHDALREATVKKAWDQSFGSNDYLFFGLRKMEIDLAILHPTQLQIFRLWQIYLENVDPLLKITHTPTLQARILDAASNLTRIAPALEALLFSIYCVSVMSLNESDCQTIFESSKKELLSGYRLGCQEALLRCRFMRSTDRDCLTALYLYLISIRPETDPVSLSSMLCITIRVAQRMGIHNESTNNKHAPFEAEMRRRLWWSLIVLDNRISEMSDFKTTTLLPIWDCKSPSNMNDFDLRPEMKVLPLLHERPTEALFVVVRGVVGDAIRHGAFHLDFANPALKALSRKPQIAGDNYLTVLERMLEDRYFRFCDSENPLQFMTIWMTRAWIEKCHLLEHYSRCSASSTHPSDGQREMAISHALSMLECDTKLMSSPLTKGYRWLINFHFPFPAYVHTVQDMRKLPLQEQAEKIWEIMSDNYEARFVDTKEEATPFFGTFSRVVLLAWEAREAAFSGLDKPLEPPRIVLGIKRKLMQMSFIVPTNDMKQVHVASGMNVGEHQMPMPVDVGSDEPMSTVLGDHVNISELSTMRSDMNQPDWSMMDWSMMDWNPMYAQVW